MIQSTETTVRGPTDFDILLEMNSQAGRIATLASIGMAVLVTSDYRKLSGPAHDAAVRWLTQESVMQLPPAAAVSGFAWVLIACAPLGIAISVVSALAALAIAVPEDLTSLPFWITFKQRACFVGFVGLVMAATTFGFAYMLQPGSDPLVSAPLAFVGGLVLVGSVLAALSVFLYWLAGFVWMCLLVLRKALRIWRRP